eukprot:1119116-Prymnesium_polylepis.1
MPTRELCVDAAQGRVYVSFRSRLERVSDDHAPSCPCPVSTAPPCPVTTRLQLLKDFKAQHAAHVCKVRSFKQCLRLHYPTATKEELTRWLAWVGKVEAEEAEAA